MKHFEISVLRHIRFAGLRKTINRTTTFNRMNIFDSKVRDILKILWKRGEISPLYHNILLPVGRSLCYNRDQIFTSRKAVIRDKRVRDNESTVVVQLVVINYHLVNLA